MPLNGEPMPAAKVVQMGFDYSRIDEGVRDEVQAAARSIHQLERGVMTGLIAIGKRLLEVKHMIPHGQFEAWCVDEFGLHPRTAQNMMNVSREYGDGQKRNIISFFSPTVAYMLAAPSTPAEAREEVEQAAASGQKVTVEFANETIAKHKPPREVKRLRDEPRKPEVMPAKAVYVEPTDAEEAAAIAEVAAEREQEEAERVEKNRSMGMLSSAWIVNTLSNDDPAHPYFRSALKGADADDLREAMASLSTEDEFCDTRLAALNARFAELEPMPAMVTLTIRRELAEQLQRSTAAFKVGDMLLVDQGELEEALTLALKGSGE